jgi:hypothetical protein
MHFLFGLLRIKGLYMFRTAARGDVVVKALRYKPKGHGFDSSGFGGLGVCMLASGTQYRGFAPDRSCRIFPAGKIHSIPSFGRRSKIICPMLVTRITKKVKKVKTVNNGTKRKKISDGVPGFFH